jgi:biopolymer transport protein TolR
MIHRFLSSRREAYNYKRNSAINVTPLVDVMLVLLIIFMVTAPMMTLGVKVDLPQAPQATSLSENCAPIVVSINAKRKIFFQDLPVTQEQLVEKLKGLQEHDPDVCVYIQGDRTLPYASVMDLMGVVSHSGISRVALMAQWAAQE